VIRAIAQILVRVLIETALVCLIIGAVLCVLAYRIGRQLVTDQPGRLEQLSGQAVTLASLIPRKRAVQRVDSDQDDETGENLL